MGRPISSFFGAIIDICYPPLCVGCNEPLSVNDASVRTDLLNYLCEPCHNKLPLWEHLDNPVALRESLLQLAAVGAPGTLPHLQRRLIFVTAYLLFEAKNASARLIHHLKYHGKTQIGTALGRRCGERVRSLHGRHFDAVIPVPIHWRRRFSRGYNQSEYIARGMAEVMDVPLRTDVLRCKRFTQSQVRRSRQKRLRMSEKFAVKDQLAVRGKSILLVDDVMTTGTTLWRCVSRLMEAEARTVGVAAASASLGGTLPTAQQRTDSANYSSRSV